MKKLLVLVCILLAACLAVSASASTVLPNAPEFVRTVLGGKTYTADITEWTPLGEGEDAAFLLTFVIAEEDTFDAAQIDSLQPGDVILFGNGTVVEISDVMPDEAGTGCSIISTDNLEYSFYKLTEDTCVAHTDTGYPFYTELFTISVDADETVRFLDWSDPENLDGPVERSFSDLVEMLNDGIIFDATNTKITFTPEGKLSEILYSYTPWN